MKLWRIISELFFPSGIKCIICGKELASENRYGVCDKCKITYNTQYCLKCGRAIANMATYCDECQNVTQPYDLARAPLIYENETVSVVHKLKYGGAKYLAENMAQFMADVYYEQNINADFITFVPMYHKKQKQRGYNQAELLANELSKLINLPVVSTLNRVKQSANLARMGRQERREAIESAFESIVTKNDVKDKNVLLIDDVFTTGATSGQCCKVLKKLKCGKITVLTFATSRQKPELY